MGKKNDQLVLHGECSPWVEGLCVVEKTQIVDGLAYKSLVGMLCY